MGRARVRIQFYVDSDDYIILEKIAKEKRLPLSILCRIIVAEWLSHLKNANSQT